MQLYRGRERLPAFPEGTALTIGNFDGLHLGHQALVQKVVKVAQKRGWKSLVVTFDPHPLQVLRPEIKLKRLFSLKDLFEQLSQRELSGLVVYAFSREFSELSPEEFFQNYLEILNPKFILVGHDFNFGAHRAGGFETLMRLAAPLGIRVEKVDPVQQGQEIVSSSRIRDCLRQGQVSAAKELLGRPFYVEGVVEKGFARGRQIGFPTANLRVTGETLPHSGVYVTQMEWSGKSYWSVTNVGFNPTVSKGLEFKSTKVESHILDFSGDIYGLEVRLSFFERIRDEMKFSGIAELRDQIQRDVEKVRQWIQQHP